MVDEDELDRFGPDDFKGGGFGTMLLKLGTEAYLTKEDLALMLDSNPGRPLPDKLRDYLVRFLRDEVKRKRGRKPRLTMFTDFELIQAAEDYSKALPRMQKIIKRRRQKAKERDKRFPGQNPLRRSWH